MASIARDDPELCNNGGADSEHFDIFGPTVSTADLIEALTLSQPTANIVPSEMSLSSIKPCPNLPTELWTTILLDAITPVTITLHRRRGFPRELELLLRRTLFCVTRKLILVCRLWRAITLPLLYETVHLKTPNMARCFLRTLVESASQPAGYGLCVRHLVLPFLKPSDAWEGFHVIDVLEWCPNLETLWKLYYSEYHDPPFWHGFSCLHSCTGCPPQPPYIKPIYNHWGNTRSQAVVQSPAPDVRHALGSITILRHIYWKFSFSFTGVGMEVKRLAKLLSYAPNLISLSMTRSSYLAETTFSSFRIRPIIPLTSLTTLEYTEHTQQPIIHHKDMPNLTHIIATTRLLRYDYPTSVLSVFGQQLEVIELLDIQSAWLSLYSAIGSFLPRCPKVDKLIYSAECNGMLHPSQSNIVLHKSLRNIVLRIKSRKRGDDELRERRLLQHFDVLTGVAFPALRRVVLEDVVGCDASFQQAYAVMSRRFSVQRIDGKDIVWEC